MKKSFLKIFLFAVLLLIPVSALAEVDVKVRVNIPLPPPILFPVPPHVVVIPQTDVYSVPDVKEDIFFYGGWWWRPWEGRWYRSRHYDRGWGHYKGRPPFHKQVPPGWRKSYHDRRWNGRQWDYRPIPHNEMERNWKSWKRNKHWEKENNWGVRRDAPRRNDPGLHRDRPGNRPGNGPDKGRDRGPDKRRQDGPRKDYDDNGSGRGHRGGDRGDRR